MTKIKSTEKSRKQQSPKTKIKSTSQTTLARMAIDSRARRRYDRALQIFKEHSIVNKTIIFKRKLFAQPYQHEAWAWDVGLTQFFELMSDKDPSDDPEDGLTIFRHHEATEVFLAVSDQFPELRKRLPRALRVLTAWGRQPTAGVPRPTPGL